MGKPVVVVDLARDLGLARELAIGGVFVPGCELELDTDCELVVRSNDSEVTVQGRVVWIDRRGAGMQLVDCTAELKQRLQALVDAAGTDGAVALPRTASISRGADATADAVAAAEVAEVAIDAIDDVSDVATDDATEGEDDWDQEWADSASDSRSHSDPGSDADADPDPESDSDPESESASGTASPRRKIALNVQQRLRGLTLAQQVKLAHTGEMTVRIALERMYHKDVWEPLLRNPRITGPEVARIARMGSLPRVLIEIIVGNGTWLQVPEVRRALLANPRLGADQILRVLRLLPKHELKLAALQTAYSHAVRDAARRMLRD